LALADAVAANGAVALSVGKIETHLGCEVVGLSSPVVAAEFCLRRVPVSAGGDRGRGKRQGVGVRLGASVLVRPDVAVRGIRMMPSLGLWRIRRTIEKPSA
jgi:hypothetical protein